MLVELGSTPQAPELADDAERALTGYPSPSAESLTRHVAPAEPFYHLEQVVQSPAQPAVVSRIARPRNHHYSSLWCIWERTAHCSASCEASCSVQPAVRLLIAVQYCTLSACVCAASCVVAQL